jgi:hypothetical protein
MAYSENPSRVMVFPDSGSGNAAGNVPAWILPFMGGGFGNNNGLFGGNNGWGGGILGFLLGLMFGNGGFGNFFGGNGWNGNNAGAGFLSNQIDNNAGRELLMNAIVSQGEQARTAIQTLSTMLGQDFNLVNGAVQSIQAAINQIANNQGLNAMQIINSIQSGNSSLANQIVQCCCQMQQTMSGHVATIQQGINGIQTELAVNRGQEELGRCQQTYTLTTNENNNNQKVLDKLCEMQTQNLQDKLERTRDENTNLRTQLSQEKQTQQFGAMLNSMMAPINARIQALDDKVDGIAAKQPNTVPVVYPNLVAVQQNPYYGGCGCNDGFFG